MLGLCSIITDGLNRTAFFGFLAPCFFFGRRRLLENVRVTAVLIALEIVGRGFAAQIAIYALVINVVFARNVLWIFVSSVSHKNVYVCPAIWIAPPPKASPFGAFIWVGAPGGWLTAYCRVARTGSQALAAGLRLQLVAQGAMIAPLEAPLLTLPLPGLDEVF